MPFRLPFRLMVKSLFGVRDRAAAEGLFFEGTYLSEKGEDAAAREAFRFAARLDARFAGAFYNFAALTEKLTGASQETIDAWTDYCRVAPNDNRQREETILRVQKHIAELKARVGGPTAG